MFLKKFSEEEFKFDQLIRSAPVKRGTDPPKMPRMSATIDEAIVMS
jgi:hypothetical protein